MKKLFTLVAAVACALAMTAAQYTGQLTVLVNGEGGQQEAQIMLEQNEDGTYTFSLKNFALKFGDNAVGVGNIILPNQEGFASYGYTNIMYVDNVNITPGDDPNIETWIGPDLGPVPLNLFGTFNDQVLSVNITIALTILPQNINVYFTGINPEAIGGDTSELEARISELEGQVSTLQGQLNQAGTDKETLQNQIDDLNNQITALKTELEGYKNIKYGDVNKDNAVTSADISEVVNVIAGLHNEGGE